MQETRVLSLGQEDPLEKEMATHSSILAWKIPWTEEPGRGPWGRKHDLVTKQQQGKYLLRLQDSFLCIVSWKTFPLNANYPACTEPLIATMEEKKVTVYEQLTFRNYYESCYVLNILHSLTHWIIATTDGTSNRMLLSLYTKKVYN